MTTPQERGNRSKNKGGCSGWLFSSGAESCVLPLFSSIGPNEGNKVEHYTALWVSLEHLSQNAGKLVLNLFKTRQNQTQTDCKKNKYKTMKRSFEIETNISDRPFQNLLNHNSLEGPPKTRWYCYDIIIISYSINISNVSQKSL